VTVALVTAIYGGHDTLKPLPAGHGFDDAVCVTDDPTVSAEGWRVVVLPSEEPPRLAAKAPKMLPFDFVKSEVAVWVDAAFEVVGDGFRDFCVDALGEHDVVVWEHPEDRDCLFREATYCQDWPKYSGEPIREQTAYYRAEGMPEGFGLWACGAIVWRNNDEAREFGRAWHQENVRWSIQDQVSFPFLVWKLRPGLTVFPAHEFQNPYLRWHPHHRSN
jgi:hypothetical protein